jgi:hypothetical protein
MEFAPEWPRNEKGWVVFPQNDRAERLKLFPEEVMGHPAMLNLFLQQSIIEYVSKEGDILMDPFGGTGTLMIAALQNRKVVLIEIEEHFHQLQQRCKVNLAYNQEILDNIILLRGDNRLVLPIPCNHIITSPPYCLAPDTPILTSDLSWVRLDSLKVGDNLISVDEYPEGGRGAKRTIQLTTVSHTNKVLSLPYTITLDDGRKVVCSSNHRWLAKQTGGTALIWKESFTLKVGDRIRHLVSNIWETPNDYQSGYISGIYDGEGWIGFSRGDSRVGFTQKPGIVAEHVYYLLDSMNFHPKVEEFEGILHFSIYNLDDCIRFIGMFKPVRLLPQFINSIIGRSLGQNGLATITNISLGLEPIELIDLTTSTGTFIANGLISHNSNAMNVQRVRKEKEGADGFLSKQDKRMQDYSKDPRNIGRLNTFLYNQNMERVYRLCYQSLLPGGTLTIVIKDRIHEGEQVWISNWATRVCIESGFQMSDWFKRESRGTAFTNIRRSKGEETVDCEDIIILKKVN